MKTDGKDYKLIDHVWEQVIIPTYSRYNQRTGGLLCFERSREEIRQHYKEILEHAKIHYMEDDQTLLNRHKVSAALMIAILKAKPIKKADALYYAPDENGKVTIWPFNEQLAITVALSVLRTFILQRAKIAFSGQPISKTIFNDACEQDFAIFREQFPISDKERADWEYELYQMRQDGAYNLLSISHILAQMEEKSRLKYFLKTHDSPKYPKSELLIDIASSDIDWESLKL